MVEVVEKIIGDVEELSLIEIGNAIFLVNGKDKKGENVFTTNIGTVTYPKFPSSVVVRVLASPIMTRNLFGTLQGMAKDSLFPY